MKGDYHRYLAEFKTGQERRDGSEQTLIPYTAAQERTRNEFLQFMARERRGFDSSTPSYSLNDINRFQSHQHITQSLDGNRRFPAEPARTEVFNAEADNATTLASVNELLNAPCRTNVTKLSPGLEGKSTWFRHDKGAITKQILKMLKSNLPRPYPTYRSLPQSIKNRWFRAFAQEFDWDSSITKSVRTGYDLQAKASFKSHVKEWKKAWKEKGPDDLPNWMKAKKSLFDGYIKLWTDAKVMKRAAQNSKNRSSTRGGLGMAIHNNGAKTFERRWDEMTDEYGKKPNMLHFMEVTHTNKKTREMKDLKAKKIIDSAKEKIQLTTSQRQAERDDSVQSNFVTEEEINAIMLEEVPKVRRGRYGFGKLLDEGGASSSFTSGYPRQHSVLQDEIKTLKERELQKDLQIQYLMECNKLLLEKFPDIRPPPTSIMAGMVSGFEMTTPVDDDETQG